jgi:hypothetical protein
MPDRIRPIAGRAVSIDVADAGDAWPVDLVLRAGQPLEPGRTGDALVLETFAHSYGLRPGDTVDVIIASRCSRPRSIARWC